MPFYVALPSSTIDWTTADGVGEIPIEERSAREVTQMTGRTHDGAVETVEIAAPGSPAANPAFDVTPARLVTASSPSAASRARAARASPPSIPSAPRHETSRFRPAPLAG